jgi:hypothetical protein
MYVIFTKKGGWVFYICQNEEKGYFVSSDAPDCDVLKIDDYELANSIADNYSNDGVKYEVKKVEV